MGLTMGIRLGAFLLPCALAAPALAQPAIPPVAYPAIAETAHTAFDFVPEGWRVEVLREGDLDADGKDDIAAVLRMRDPANVLANPLLGEDPFDTNPRILLVALREGDDHFRRVLADHVLIPRRENPAQEDPFSGIEVRKGVLRVSLENFMSAGGWATWRTAYAFRWQASRFVLIGYDRSELARNTGEGEDISIDYLTGRRKTVKSQMEGGRQTVGWRMEPHRGPIVLQTIGDGLEWDPDK